MQKMTIADAAEFFGISKEAIHNRVRRGSLESEIIDGEKHVFVDKNKASKSAATKKTTTPKTTRAKSTTPRSTAPKVDDRYYNLLKEQNTQLQAKVEKLEGETRNLRDQKEQMLIEERKKIEQIYKDKDEQLKNILSAISSNFILNAPATENDTEESQHLDAEIEFGDQEINVENSNITNESTKVSGLEETITLDEIQEIEEYEEILQNKEYKKSNKDDLSILTSLNKYLKARDFSKKKRKKIKEKFEKNSDKDKRVIKLNEKIYIDLGKYTYSDYSL